MDIEQIECKNITELNNRIFELLNKQEKWVFRGEDSSKYKLLPSALRSDRIAKLKEIINIDKENSNDTYGQIAEELSAVYFFYEEANKQGLLLPQGVRYKEFAKDIGPLVLCRYTKYEPDKKYFLELFDKYADIISLAQHYGIPTRFLDWTSDFHVAYYFSFYNFYNKNNKKNNNKLHDDSFVIWAINKNAVDLGILQDLSFITPSYNFNPNIIAQKGLFSFYNNINNIPLTEIGINIKKINIYKKYKKYKTFIYKFTLPHTEFRECFSYLHNIGYTYAKIFPGYSSIKQQLIDNMSLRRQKKSTRSSLV